RPDAGARADRSQPPADARRAPASRPMAELQTVKGVSTQSAQRTDAQRKTKANHESTKSTKDTKKCISLWAPASPWRPAKAGRCPRTAEGIVAFLTRCTRRTAVAVEATGPTWSFVDAIAERVGQVCVVDTRKTKLKAGYAAKTDRLDARRLADALRRESVVSIYVPAPVIRERREVCRGRHQVVRLRTRLAQMIRALLLRCDAGEPPGTRLYAA